MLYDLTAVTTPHAYATLKRSNESSQTLRITESERLSREINEKLLRTTVQSEDERERISECVREKERL